MITNKKLIPLSTLVSDITGLSYNFPSFPVLGDDNITLQLVFQDLNANTALIKFQQSLDDVNFDDIVDADGVNVEITLSSAQTSFTINLYNTNTAYIRPVLVLNTLTAGSFTNYTVLTS